MLTKVESFYLCNGWFRMTNSTLTIHRQQLSLSYLEFNFSRCLNQRSKSIRSKNGKIKIFLSFLTQNGLKVHKAPCTYVNVFLMQSNMLNWMRIWKRCFKVIKETVQPVQPWKFFLKKRDCATLKKLAEKFIVQCRFDGLNRSVTKIFQIFCYIEVSLIFSTLCQNPLWCSYPHKTLE